MPAPTDPVRQKFYALLGFCALNWAGMAVAVGYGWARADDLGPTARYWLHGSAALCVLLLLGLVYLYLTLGRVLAQRSAVPGGDGLEAEHEPLSGLVNRRGFNLHLELALAHARRAHQPLTLLHASLDGPAGATGDRYARVLAERWQDAVRDDEALAWLGDGAFAVLAYGNGEGAQVLAQRLVDLAEGGVSVSIGLAEYPRHGADRQALASAANLALQAAKTAGAPCYRWAQSQ